ncbi:MAG: hypothetical protein Q8K58_12860 [Acidimicrobiales bacterium]|nr:hypothetical protein [Acidimicrobiales bacterium]
MASDAGGAMAEREQDEVGGDPDVLAPAREALGRWAWAEALELAQAAAAVTTADDRSEAERCDLVADASWWLGSLDDCIAHREQAHAKYEAVGDHERAGQCAVWLYEHNMMKTRSAISGAWLRRAERSLQGHTDGLVYGNLLTRRAEVTHGGGDLEGALALAREAIALGRRLGSADLEAEAQQAAGRVLIDLGQVEDGLGQLDEAMLTAVEGKLSPFSAGKVHCSMISACELLGDLRRAAEWTEATLRWSEAHPFAMWPGICRVHHAALLQMHGDWEAAEREARRACDELDGFHIPNVAAGHVEIGEIRRRLGDLDGAEEAFAKAERLSGQQSAGMALVRLAQQRIDAAAALIGRLLGEQTWNQLARAKLLPAQVQIAVAAGDLTSAESAAAELEAIAEAHDGPLLTASALSARGRLQLACGDPAQACATLQQALQQWLALEVPYEVATARLLIGQACRTCGDEEGAAASLRQAAEIFDRLGAAIEIRALRDLAQPTTLPGGLTHR